MEDLTIENVEKIPCENSKFIATRRVSFKQNQHKRVWDYVLVHDAVAVMLYNTTRKAFVLVKQFRPAVYMYALEKANAEQKKTLAPLEGVTYELCAGIVDTNDSLVDTARREALEETGYDIPVEAIHRVMKWNGNVGIGGNVMTLFFAEVTDDMQVSSGGGNIHEGEFIELFYLPIDKAEAFVFDETLRKPAGLVSAFMWYFWKKNVERHL